MKKIILALTIFTAVFTACNKNDANNTSSVNTTAVNSTVTSGTWRITLFNDSGTDETANFSGFNFTFASSGSLAAANNILTISGTWSTRVDNSKVKLTINFPSPSVSAFLDLNEDWEVTSRTDTQVTMQHVSGGGGGTDYLTFQKN
jgi:hypothetical protein